MRKPHIFHEERLSLNLVKYHKHGKTFELVVDPDLAIAYKDKKQKNLEDLKELLKAENIFFDAKKGELVSEQEVKSVFGTNNILEAADKMLHEGEIQLTAEHREKLRQDKKKKIVELIHRSAINPKTGTPHPVSRIENALEEAKIKVDEFKKAEDQVSDILSRLKPIIPIKFEQRSIDIKLPLQYAAKLRNLIVSYGKLEREEWLGDGSYACRIKIPAGLQSQLIDDLNNRTHGNVNISIEK